MEIQIFINSSINLTFYSTLVLITLQIIFHSKFSIISVRTDWRESIGVSIFIGVYRLFTTPPTKRKQKEKKDRSATFLGLVPNHAWLSNLHAQFWSKGDCNTNLLIEFEHLKQLSVWLQQSRCYSSQNSPPSAGYKSMDFAFKFSI